MPRIILTLLALGILAVLTVLWIQDPFAPPRGAAAEPGAVASGPEATPLEGVPPLEAPDRGDDRSSTVRAEAVIRADEGNAESTAVAVETIRVVTVDYGSDVPLPGTVIGLATSTRMRDFRDAHPDSEGADIEELVELAGQRFVSDENGEASLPFYGEGMRITARNEDRFTYAWLDGSETQPVRIELYPDRELSVQVVDASGQPTPGVPVAIVVKTLRSANELWKGETEGEAGLARLRHADVRLAPAYGSGTLVAELDIPTKLPVEVAFEPDPWPSEPLRIVLPETGSVTVRLLDAAAQPYEEPARVTLIVEREAGENTVRRRLNYVRRTETGVATFEHVGLETSMRVRARSEDELKPQSDVLEGPLRAGQQVELSITFDDRYPRIVGRLLDVGGRPLAAQPIEAQVLAHSPTRSRRSRDVIETDAEGRFELVIKQTLRDGDTRTVELRARAGGAILSDLSGQLDLPRALSDEDLDVGDIQLEPAALICAGSVVDDSGAPVSGANVRLDHARFASGATNWERSSTATSAPDGGFELRGDVPPTELRVVATKSGWSNSGPVVVTAGRTDLVLRLDRNGSLAGYLELNRGVPARMFEVRAVWDRVDAFGERRRGNRAARPSPNGSFELEGIPPGFVTVRVVFTGAGVNLRTLEGILITGGEATRDARLSGLDLTAEVFAYEIEVVDTALQPVRGGSVSVAPKGRNQGRPMAFAISAGLARLITLENLVDVVVSAPGFRNALIRGVHTDQQVMLEAAIAVRLKLADEIALPQPPLYLQAKLVPAGIQKKKRKVRATQIYQDGEWVGSSNPLSLDESNTFGTSREIRVQVSEPGPHSVHFEVLKKRPQGGRRSQALGGGKPRQIQVDAADAGRTFEVAPPRQAYQRALQRLSE